MSEFVPHTPLRLPHPVHIAGATLAADTEVFIRSAHRLHIRVYVDVNGRTVTARIERAALV